MTKDMAWYQPRGWGFRPNFIVQYRDLNGVDRSVPLQFSDTTADLAKDSPVKGFWRIKWKEQK